jgi:deoxyribodipyrimidine photo-lyase
MSGYPPLAEIALQYKPFAIPVIFQGLLDVLIKLLNVQTLSPSLFHTQQTLGQHTHSVAVRPKPISVLTISSIVMPTNYHSTLNDLLGKDFSTKLSVYLALGSITARQIYAILVSFEDGTNLQFKSTIGYGQG